MKNLLLLAVSLFGAFSMNALTPDERMCGVPEGTETLYFFNEFMYEGDGYNGSAEFQFDANGCLVSIDGDSLTVTRDEFQRIATARTSSADFTLTYNADGRVITATGKQLDYGSDAQTDKWVDMTINYTYTADGFIDTQTSIGSDGAPYVMHCQYGKKRKRANIASDDTLKYFFGFDTDIPSHKLLAKRTFQEGEGSGRAEGTQWVCVILR